MTGSTTVPESNSSYVEEEVEGNGTVEDKVGLQGNLPYFIWIY